MLIELGQRLLIWQAIEIGEEAQDVVTEALGEDVMLVGPKQVNRTVDKLGLDTADLGEKDLRKLSKELHPDRFFGKNLGSLIEAVNRLGSLFYGSLLGVFTLDATGDTGYDTAIQVGEGAPFIER